MYFQFDWRSPASGNLYEIKICRRQSGPYDVSVSSLTRKHGGIDERARGRGEVQFSITHAGAAVVNQALNRGEPLEKVLPKATIYQHTGCYGSASLPLSEFLK